MLKKVKDYSDHLLVTIAALMGTIFYALPIMRELPIEAQGNWMSMFEFAIIPQTDTGDIATCALQELGMTSSPFLGIFLLMCALIVVSIAVQAVKRPRILNIVRLAGSLVAIIWEIALIAKVQTLTTLDYVIDDVVTNAQFGPQTLAVVLMILMWVIVLLASVAGLGNLKYGYLCDEKDY